MQMVDRCWPLLTVDATPSWRHLAKRLFDLMGAVMLLVGLAPLMAVCAMLIWLELPGPILVRQRGIGLGGRRFTFMRFRSTYQQPHSASIDQRSAVSASGAMTQSSLHQEQVTRVGSALRRYGLDELPQLWSVIWGDMSLVGPRPGLPQEVGEYEDAHLHRLAVKPGITGLWQVQRDRHPALADMFELDLAYVERRSVLLDVALLFRTVPAIVRRRR